MPSEETRHEFDEACRILDKAIAHTSMLYFGGGWWEYITRMLEETRAEYEPDEEGRIPAVICPHCWDNINLARIIIGESVDEYWKDERG